MGQSMSIAVACSKIWDKNLTERLQKQLGVEIILISEKDQLTKENLKRLSISKIFFPHWSFIIKPEIFEEFECIIFHMTDLPYGRGGSPLQNLIVRGHKNTKISALRCSAGIDTGPIYLKKDLSLAGTAQEIFSRATEIIETMIVEIYQNKLSPVDQAGEVVLFDRRKPEDSNLSGIHDLEKIYDYIRMLDAEGYPKAFLETQGVRYEFHSAEWNGSELSAQVRIVKK